jgi:REP element-mobilizing transposase RayT
MARIARHHLVRPGHPHHVITRGNNRRRLFSYPRDFLRFLAYLQESLVDTRCALHQLTLMPNHLHLIATPPRKGSLSRLMKIPLQRYARWRNDWRDSSGRLYEERFWSEFISSDFELSGYIYYCDANAFKAGLVTAPAEHVWSTCGFHWGTPERSRIPREMWTPSPWYAELGVEAPLRYQAGMIDFLEDRVPEWRFEKLVKIEGRASLRYRRRVQRPDGSSAR